MPIWYQWAPASSAASSRNSIAVLDPGTETEGDENNDEGKSHSLASDASPHRTKGLLLGRLLPIFTDFYRFFGLSWETSPQENLTVLRSTSTSLKCASSRWKPSLAGSGGFTNITNILVSFTSKFTNILEFISKIY